MTGTNRAPLSRSANKYDLNDPNLNFPTTTRGPATTTRYFPYTIQFSGDRLTVAGPSQVYGLRRFTVESLVQIISGTISATANQPTKITLRLKYNLRKRNEGIVQLAFNLDGPDSFRVIANEALKETEGEIEISATTTPKDWGEAATFKAVVFIREGTLSTKGDVIALKSHAISLTK